MKVRHPKVQTDSVTPVRGFRGAVWSVPMGLPWCSVTGNLHMHYKNKSLHRILLKNNFKLAKNHLKLQMLLKSVEVRVQQQKSHSFFLPFLFLTSEYRSINIKNFKQKFHCIL